MAGKRGVYSDGVRSWANLRVPKDSNTEPKWDDETELLYPLDEHADAIGSSGWDWRHQQSLYLGFDFDSVTAHAKGVGVSDADLRAIRDAAPPWVEIRRSTSGGEGVHFYIRFHEGIPCANHVEHAVLARAVLGMMSSEVGFDFNGKLDCYGAILWVWRRRMGEKGFELLRAATRQLSTYDLPPNLRDHIEVVKGRRSQNQDQRCRAERGPLREAGDAAAGGPARRPPPGTDPGDPGKPFHLSVGSRPPSPADPYGRPATVA